MANFPEKPRSTAWRASRKAASSEFDPRRHPIERSEFADRTRTPNEFGPYAEQSDAAVNAAYVQSEINRTECDERDEVCAQGLRQTGQPRGAFDGRDNGYVSTA